ncbi:MAG TPA: hypothetical protein DD738_15745 [Ruminiclostridium sp.]|nr:hypothetical protein [Bacillota bacterium]HBR04052.1 hypothetical protein [Ruminiclostridium sp.]
MMNMKELISEVFSYFNDTFDTLSKKDSNIQQAKADFDQLINSLNGHYQLNDNDRMDIEESVCAVVTAVQKLAYLKGISDGVRFNAALQSNSFIDTVLNLRDN